MNITKEQIEKWLRLGRERSPVYTDATDGELCHWWMDKKNKVHRQYGGKERGLLASQDIKLYVNELYRHHSDEIVRNMAKQYSMDERCRMCGSKPTYHLCVHCESASLLCYDCYVICKGCGFAHCKRHAEDFIDGLCGSCQSIKLKYPGRILKPGWHPTFGFKSGKESKGAS